ncbi:MAG: PASTA domain-containing protein [Acidobacteriota bacterium]
MSIISKSFSALGKLAVVGALLIAFIGGMAGVVYMSLTGSEIKVPEIVGKNFVESEKELASLGLKIRKRADRVSAEQMNTVLEQLPKAGETVKTGQWISVVVSKAGAPSEEAPSSLKKDIETDDSETIEDMISDKPKKKTNSNTNKKKADTTRDVIANTATSISNSASDGKDVLPAKSEDGDKKTEKGKEPASAPKPQSSPVEKPKNEPR